MASYSQPTSQPSKGGKKDRRRSAGEGSTYQTKDGRWRGLVTWTDPDGTRRRRYVSGRTQADARAAADKLRADLKLGTITAAGGGVTVGEWLVTWIARHKLRVRPSTWEHAETHVRCYLVPALGRIQLARLSANDVERALASFVANGRPVSSGDRARGKQKHNPVSPVTARHVRATLRSALRDAKRDGLVGTNVASDAYPPRVSHRPVAYLSAAEVHAVLRAAEGSPIRNLIAVAATTGLRLGELLGLTWRDVRGDSLTVHQALARGYNNTWVLGEPKSERSRRTIPLPRSAAEALERERQRQAANRAAAGTLWRGARDNLVFTDELGNQLLGRSVSGPFRRIVDPLDIPHVTFHDLRHSAATMMLAEGVPLAVISEWLGHSEIGITAKFYAAIVPELRQDAADAMDRAMRDDGKP